MPTPDTPPSAASRSASQPWTPSDQDHLVYHWVKFEGRKQSWVAQQLGIHEMTVSRMILRYERWVAHDGPSQQGDLSHEERRRVQRWLTYQRNEWILAAALRIASKLQQ